jgi:hypothetical protein
MTSAKEASNTASVGAGSHSENGGAGQHSA